MLTQRLDAFARFTRHDLARFVIASGILVTILTVILGADILPQESLTLATGDLAPRDIIAPKAVEFESAARTEAERAAAREVGRAPVRLHDRERRCHRQRAAARVRAPRPARRHDVRRRPAR